MFKTKADLEDNGVSHDVNIEIIVVGTRVMVGDKAWEVGLSDKRTVLTLTTPDETKAYFVRDDKHTSPKSAEKMYKDIMDKLYKLT